MTEAVEGIGAYQSAFAERCRDLDAREPEWLASLRERSLARLAASGLPTGREEAWRQTPVAPVVAAPFRPVGRDRAPMTEPLPPDARIALPEAVRLVFVDGRFRPALSVLPRRDAPFFVGSLASALLEFPAAVEKLLGRLGSGAARPFEALNDAFFEDAAVIRIPAGREIGEPIHLVHVAAHRGEAEMTCPRALVVAEPGSRAVVVETFTSANAAAGLTSAVAEIEIGDGASIDHVRVQAESPSSLHVGAVDARLGRDARFTSHAVSLGARWARIEIGAALADVGAECWLNGLYLADGSRHVDHRTSVDHAAPHGASHQLYKGLLLGAARAVFHGKILVREDAQKTDAYQSNRNLLLSEDALVFTRPQLEIHANDVKCTHGATVGRLDPEALFYLRSRGMGPEEAGRLLIRAFTGEVLARIHLEAVRERLEGEVASRLPMEASGGKNA
jgi:Fe-S cluster assembly protein SufD